MLPDDKVRGPAGLIRLAYLLGWARALLYSEIVPGRRRRMRNFYTSFLDEGDLCFDLGAHVGSRTATLAGIGCTVIAVEPHPYLAFKLANRFASRPNVLIKPVAIGKTRGHATLYCAPGFLSVSSLDSQWTGELRKVRPHGVKFSQTIPVEVRTLNDLIEEFGTPTYCKIDIEGLDVDALSSLNEPVDVISFEHLPQLNEATRASIEALERLGAYRYNYFPKDSHRFALAKPVEPDELLRALKAKSSTTYSYDIFAFRGK